MLSQFTPVVCDAVFEPHRPVNIVQLCEHFTQQFSPLFAILEQAIAEGTVAQLFTELLERKTLPFLMKPEDRLIQLWLDRRVGNIIEVVQTRPMNTMMAYFMLDLVTWFHRRDLAHRRREMNRVRKQMEEQRKEEEEARAKKADSTPATPATPSTPKPKTTPPPFESPLAHTVRTGGQRGRRPPSRARRSPAKGSPKAASPAVRAPASPAAASPVAASPLPASTPALADAPASTSTSAPAPTPSAPGDGDAVSAADTDAAPPAQGESSLTGEHAHAHTHAHEHASTPAPDTPSVDPSAAPSEPAPGPPRRPRRAPPVRPGPSTPLSAAGARPMRPSPLVRVRVAPRASPPPPSGFAALDAAVADKTAQEAAEKEALLAQGPPASEDPRYTKFFRLLKIGVPRARVEEGIAQAGLDPSVLSHPDRPAPP